MTFKKTFKSFLCALILFIFSSLGTVHAQDTKAEKDTVLSVIDRFSFRTNAVEWLLTVPNFAVEFDLKSSAYNRNTINLNLKYNWNTWHNFSPSTVFNLFEIKPEFRHYWRYAVKDPRAEGEKVGFFQWLKEDAFSRERVHAKPWRAWYFGPYASFGTYALKIGPTGRDGYYLSAGVSFGYGLPLYTYEKGAVDVEFGLSLGAVATGYNAFGHNPIGNYYTEKADLSRSLHVLPYPMLTEVRVAFVYRTRSIQDKYTKTDPRIVAKRLEKSKERDQKAEEKRLAEEVKAQEKQDKEAMKQAEKDAKVAEKEGKAAEKETAKLDKAAKKEAMANMTKEEKKAAKAAEKEQAKAAKDEAKANKDAKADKKANADDKATMKSTKADDKAAMKAAKAEEKAQAKAAKAEAKANKDAKAEKKVDKAKKEGRK